MPPDQKVPRRLEPWRRAGSSTGRGRRDVGAVAGPAARAAGADRCLPVSALSPIGRQSYRQRDVVPDHGQAHWSAMPDRPPPGPSELATPPAPAGPAEPTEPTVIFETVHGSQAYGLARAGSDIDRKGIVIGPAAWYFGWIGGPEQLELTPDHMRYDIRKFMRLAAQANPTIFELLWTRPEDHLVVAPVAGRLLDARDQFLSKRVAERFGRYAHSQLKRIRTHRAWLLDPPAGPPSRHEFGLPERMAVSADQLGAAEALRASEATAALMIDAVEPNFIELLNREKAYKAAQLHWKQYRSWLANRNHARAALEAQFGYDTKHAMHLVRLQRMAEEILRTGVVQVHRPDRDELLAIRDGAWTYDELERRTEELAADIERAATASTLPDEPDDLALDLLCVSLIEEHLR